MSAARVSPLPTSEVFVPTIRSRIPAASRPSRSPMSLYDRQWRSRRKAMSARRAAMTRGCRFRPRTSSTVTRCVVARASTSSSTPAARSRSTADGAVDPAIGRGAEGWGPAGVSPVGRGVASTGVAGARAAPSSTRHRRTRGTDGASRSGIFGSGPAIATGRAGTSGGTTGRVRLAGTTAGGADIGTGAVLRSPSRAASALPTSHTRQAGIGCANPGGFWAVRHPSTLTVVRRLSQRNRSLLLVVISGRIVMG